MRNVVLLSVQVDVARAVSKDDLHVPASAPTVDLEVYLFPLSPGRFSSLCNELIMKLIILSSSHQMFQRVSKYLLSLP